MLKLIICEDDEQEMVLLKEWLVKIIAKHNLAGSIEFTSSDIEEILLFIRKNPDEYVLLLDIKLGGQKTGLDLANRLREFDVMSYIVYVTAYSEYWHYAFSTDAYDYLQKPVIYTNLEECIMRIVYKKRIYNEKEYVSLKFSESKKEFVCKNIECIETDGNYLFINFADGSPTVKLRKPTKREEDIEIQIKGISFLRQCHKSFIINQNYIKNYYSDKNYFEMKSGIRCSISRGKKQNVNDLLNEKR